MVIYRSKSFFILVLSGLVFVALPLIIVLATSDQMMSRLAEHSSLAVYRSVSGSQLSQRLIEQLVAQERRVRQYAVLGDEQLLAEIGKLHRKIQKTGAGLLKIPYQAAQQTKIRELLGQEQLIFTSLMATSPLALKENGLLQEFSALNRLGNEIIAQINAHTHREIGGLQKEAVRAKATLFWLALTLVPLTVTLIVFFTRLISRPITEIDRGINRLGQGDFSSRITVSGPEDLVFLGNRLDWLRQKLAAFEQEKIKFSAHISHELKTPLASIREGAELLADEIAGPVSPQQQEIIAILKKNSLQLQELIENLLGYTMAQAKKTCLQITEFSLRALLEKTLESYQAAILKKKLTLTLAVDELRLTGDRRKLETVIDNLLSNAAKYTPPGGAIQLLASRQAERVRIDLIDSGPGIPAEEEELIFTPFFQGKTKSRGHINGTGLGLAIAREYVAGHGGSLRIMPASSGHGAHFRVELPLIASEDLACG